jgi:hypothetical protein
MSQRPVLQHVKNKYLSAKSARRHLCTQGDACEASRSLQYALVDELVAPRGGALVKPGKGCAAVLKGDSSEAMDIPGAFHRCAPTPPSVFLTDAPPCGGCRDLNPTASRARRIHAGFVLILLTWWA